MTAEGSYRWLAGLLCLFLAAACAPRLAPEGPGPGPARIDVGADEGDSVLVTEDGYRLKMRGWLPDDEPRAVVLALHGFNDHSTFIAPAAEAWAQEGIATFAYDQRGFGSSPNLGLWAGAEAYAGDALDGVALLRDRYPDRPVYLLGESMGGAIAIAAATGDPNAELDGVILAAPSVWDRDTMPFGHRVSLFFMSHTLPWLALSPSGVEVQASDNIDALIALGRDPLVIKRTRIDAVHGLVDLMDLAQERAVGFDAPALFLYGEKDELVPPEAMALLWQRLPEGAEGQRRALYPEGWHLLFKDLQAKTVIEDVAAWIKAPDQPLPSGADSHAEAWLAEDDTASTTTF